MPDLEGVIARFHDDPAFRDALTRRPRDALAGFRLSRSDLEQLAGRLAETCDCSDVADRRHALAGLLRLLALTTTAAPDPADA